MLIADLLGVTSELGDNDSFSSDVSLRIATPIFMCGQ